MSGPELDNEVADHFGRLDLDSIIHCSSCGLFVEAHLWRPTEVGCEDCGSHPAIVHGACGPMDMILNEPQVLHNLGPSTENLQGDGDVLLH